MKNYLKLLVVLIIVITPGLIIKYGISDIADAFGISHENYQNACRSGDFESAHEILNTLHNKYLKKYGAAQLYNDENLCVAREKYYAALNFIFNQEIMILASDGREQASDKIAFLLTEIPVDGKARPNGDYYWHLVSDSEPDGKEHATYCKWVTNYNSLCSQAVDLAISQNNEYLAKKILTMYKQNVETTDSRDNAHYNVNRSWSDKDEAIAKCKEAGFNV